MRVRGLDRFGSLRITLSLARSKLGTSPALRGRFQRPAPSSEGLAPATDGHGGADGGGADFARQDAQNSGGDGGRGDGDGDARENDGDDGADARGRYS